MKKTLTRLAAFALMAVMSTGIIVPVQTASVYAKTAVEDVDKSNDEVIDWTKPSSSSGKTKTAKKTKSKSGSIAAPSANYTGLAKSGGKTYYFKNGKICAGFIKTDSGYMYFDPKTYAMTTGFVYSKGLYCFDQNGIMLTDGTYTIGQTKYHFGKDGRATTPPVAGKNTILIPNILRYDMTSASEYFDKKGTSVPLKKKQALQESEDKMFNSGGFSVMSEKAFDTSVSTDIRSDLKELGYTVELYDAYKEGNIFYEQYIIYSNNIYAGLLVLQYDHTNLFGYVSVMGASK